MDAYEQIESWLISLLRTLPLLFFVFSFSPVLAVYISMNTKAKPREWPLLLSLEAELDDARPMIPTRAKQPKANRLLAMTGSA